VRFYARVNATREVVTVEKVLYAGDNDPQYEITYKDGSRDRLSEWMAKSELTSLRDDNGKVITIKH